MVGVLGRFNYLAPFLVIALVLPLFLTDYMMEIANLILVFAIAGLGINLLFGYTGRLSLGHSAYFGAGVYAGGFVYRFFGTTQIEVYLLSGIAVSTLLAVVFGYISSRHTRLYFSILTLALSQVVHVVVLFLITYFAFFNGIEPGFALRVRRPTILGISLETLSFREYQMVMYYIILVVFLVLLFVMWKVVNSPFGLALKAIRENDFRAEYSGIPVKRYVWYAFILSGFYAGFAGALFAQASQVATPRIIHWIFSIELVVMVILGGYKTFIGPLLGAATYTILNTAVFSFTVYWRFLLGVLVVALGLMFPEGIIGAVRGTLRSMKVKDVEEL